MNFLTWGTNPWGQDVLIRISWDLLWLAAVAGVLFVIVHAVYVAVWVPQRKYHGFDESAESGPAVSVPERVARHSLASRLFHGIMAATMFVLLFSGFLPVVGVQFAWVTIHWVAGVILTLSIVYHVVHVSFWLDLWSMAIGPADVSDALRRIKRSVGQAAPAPKKHGKYPLENKLYHHIIVLTAGMVIGTGLFMMFRVDTPFWTRDPYLFTAQTWGLIYVLHGLSSVSLVTLVIAHVYFGIRPEKRSITWSMIHGWVDRGHYIEHHDPARWAPERAPEPTGAVSASSTQSSNVPAG